MIILDNYKAKVLCCGNLPQLSSVILTIYSFPVFILPLDGVMHWNQKRFPLSLLFTQDFSQVHSHRNLTVSESDHVINMTPYPWFDLIWLISNTLLHKIGSWCTKPSHRAVHLWVVSMHWNRERFPLSLNSCDQNFSHLAAPIETSGCQNLTAVLIWCHHQDSGGSLMTQMVQLRSKKKLSCGEKMHFTFSRLLWNL